MECAHNLQFSKLSATNLYVALISEINCRLLANEKTDSDYNI